MQYRISIFLLLSFIITACVSTTPQTPEEQKRRLAIDILQSSAVSPELKAHVQQELYNMNKPRYEFVNTTRGLVRIDNQTGEAKVIK